MPTAHRSDRTARQESYFALPIPPQMCIVPL